MRDVVESENYGSAYGVYSVPGYNVSAKTEQPKSLLIQGISNRRYSLPVFDCGDGSF